MKKNMHLQDYHFLKTNFNFPARGMLVKKLIILLFRVSAADAKLLRGKKILSIPWLFHVLSLRQPNGYTIAADDC